MSDFVPEELARRARVEQAAESRSRRATWSRAEAEGATLAGLLARGGEVMLQTVVGPVAGTVIGLGRDHCTLAGPADHCYLRLDAVEVVEVVAPGAPVARVDRTLTEVLARLVDTATTVSLRTRSGATVTGTVDSVGEDVVALHPATGTGAVYASSSSLVAARLVGVGSG